MEQQVGTTNFYESPIANPLSSPSLTPKILSLARHLNRDKKLRRGVKDVSKALRKGADGICILAADTCPVDVLSHLPVMCQDRGIPYVWVRSRLELGVAAETKKPTSVILMLKPDENEKLEAKFLKLKENIKQSHPFM